MRLDYRIIAVVLGMIDGVYLTAVHFLPGALACPTIGTVVDCEAVLSSAFSNVFGIPLAVLGLAWFVGMLAFYASRRRGMTLNLWMIIGLGGILYSISAQAVIGRICIYCAALDAIILSTVLLFLHHGGKAH